jgi:hypothetical protein
VPFGPKRLKDNQKVEIETGQIQGLHVVLVSSFIIRFHAMSRSAAAKRLSAR